MALATHAQSDRLASLPSSLVALQIGAFLSDLDAERWVRCNKRSLQQLQLYRFKTSLSMAEAIRLSSTALVFGRFGLAEHVWTACKDDALRLQELPSTVRRMRLAMEDRDSSVSVANRQLPRISASVMELYIGCQPWDATTERELSELLADPSVGLRVLDIKYFDQGTLLSWSTPIITPFILPQSLTTLVLGDFDSPLSLALPASLTDLRMPRFSQAAVAWPRLPSQLRVLHCDHDAPIGEIMLPPSLVELRTFFHDGPWRNYPRDCSHLASWNQQKVCPPALQVLTLAEYNEPKSRLQLHLPPTIHTLCLPSFHQPLDELRFPDSITHLTISCHPDIIAFNRVCWPSRLRELHFYDFTLPLRDWNTPPSLTSLHGISWNHHSSELSLPRTLISLRLSAAFNESLGNVLAILSNLQDLHLGDEFNQPILAGQLPKSLMKLTLSDAWQLPATQLQLTPCLCTLRFGTSNSVASLLNLQLPSSLTELDLEPSSMTLPQRCRDHLQLPAGLLRLRLPRCPLSSYSQLPSLPVGLRELFSPPNPRLRQWAEDGGLPSECVLIDDPHPDCPSDIQA